MNQVMCVPILESIYCKHPLKKVKFNCVRYFLPVLKKHPCKIASCLRPELVEANMVNYDGREKHEPTSSQPIFAHLVG